MILALSDTDWQRLFGVRHAFDNPVVAVATAFIVLLLVATPLVIGLLVKQGRVTPAHRKELIDRYKSWLIFAPMMTLPVLAGGFWTVLAACALSIACYREYARATGLFREKAISLCVVIGIFAISFAALDRWYRLFAALSPLIMTLIAVVAILRDDPKGYIQRVGLGVLAFMLFGVCFGHLAYFANDPNYRAILFLLLISVQLNDVFAYIVGKSIGRRKLAPNTSPNKTVGGSLGALVLTTTLVALLGRYVFRGTILASPVHLIALGVLLSAAGQFGDLLLSSVKRDVGIKDMGNLFPGHGGLLDRFNSTLLAAPVLFHYIGYFVGGIAVNDPPRIFTGW